MIVHILTHRWNTPDDEGYEILNAFRDIEVARNEMRELASETKEWLDKKMGGCPWNHDLTWEADNAVYLGWYGERCEPDWSWSWEIESVEVQ